MLLEEFDFAMLFFFLVRFFPLKYKDTNAAVERNPLSILTSSILLRESNGEKQLLACLEEWRWVNHCYPRRTSYA